MCTLGNKKFELTQHMMTIAASGDGEKSFNASPSMSPILCYAILTLSIIEREFKMQPMRICLVRIMKLEETHEELEGR